MSATSQPNAIPNTGPNAGPNTGGAPSGLPRAKYLAFAAIAVMALYVTLS